MVVEATDGREGGAVDEGFKRWVAGQHGDDGVCTGNGADEGDELGHGRRSSLARRCSGAAMIALLSKLWPRILSSGFKVASGSSAAADSMGALACPLAAAARRLCLLSGKTNRPSLAPFYDNALY